MGCALRATCPESCLGRLAENIGAVAGKQATGDSQRPITPFGPGPSYVRLRVAAPSNPAFTIWMPTGDSCRFRTQKAFDLTDVVTSIELMLDDIYQAPQVASVAEKLIGPKPAATTRGEQNKQLLGALTMERTVTVTIGLIQLVAALNI
jgi:ABC-type lipoprotein release transport system permease subunit